MAIAAAGPHSVVESAKSARDVASVTRAERCSNGATTIPLLYVPDAPRIVCRMGTALVMAENTAVGHLNWDGGDTAPVALVVAVSGAGGSKSLNKKARNKNAAAKTADKGKQPDVAADSESAGWSI